MNKRKQYIQLTKPKPFLPGVWKIRLSLEHPSLPQRAARRSFRMRGARWSYLR